MPSFTRRSPSDLIRRQLRGRPKRTSLAFAATRPLLVRWWISSRSNSATPAMSCPPKAPRAIEALPRLPSASPRYQTDSRSTAPADRAGSPPQHRYRGSGQAAGRVPADCALRLTPSPRTAGDNRPPSMQRVIVADFDHQSKRVHSQSLCRKYVQKMRIFTADFCDTPLRGKSMLIHVVAKLSEAGTDTGRASLPVSLMLPRWPWLREVYGEP